MEIVAIDRQLLMRAFNHIASEAEGTHCGHPLVEDPRDFHPDEEMCSDEEVAAWKRACEMAEKGHDVETPRPHEPLTDGDGNVIGHVTRARWGIGISTLRDTQLCELRDELAKALETT